MFLQSIFHPFQSQIHLHAGSGKSDINSLLKIFKVLLKMKNVKDNLKQIRDVNQGGEEVEEMSCQLWQKKTLVT